MRGMKKSPGRSALPLVALLALVGCGRGHDRIAAGGTGGRSLAGDWDVYNSLETTPHAGFEGWRRFGFAHFASGSDGLRGAIRRRTGESILEVTRITASAESLSLSNAGSSAMTAAWHGDTLLGVLADSGRVTGPRLRLVRRAAPFVVERAFSPWPGSVSDSQYAVTEDTLIFMRARDGARLASYVARPVGAGPFGVVLQRTPYERVLPKAGRWWASCRV